jgi:hypothetical protein
LQMTNAAMSKAKSPIESVRPLENRTTWQGVVVSR